MFKPLAAGIALWLLKKSGQKLFVGGAGNRAVFTQDGDTAIVLQGNGKTRVVTHDEMQEENYQGGVPQLYTCVMGIALQRVLEEAALDMSLLETLAAMSFEMRFRGLNNAATIIDNVHDAIALSPERTV